MDQARRQPPPDMNTARERLGVLIHDIEKIQAQLGGPPVHADRGRHEQWRASALAALRAKNLERAGLKTWMSARHESVNAQLAVLMGRLVAALRGCDLPDKAKTLVTQAMALVKEKA